MATRTDMVLDQLKEVQAVLDSELLDDAIIEIELLRDALLEIIDVEDHTWKPMQVFRTDEEVSRDEIRHEMASEIAKIAKRVLLAGAH